MILKKHKTTSFIEKHAIQTNICSNLKAVFFSKDEASIKRSVQHISELFIKVSNDNNNLNKYFKELEFRLNFLIDNKSGITSRIRCLRTISLCAVQLMLAGNSQLLDFIIEYCIKLSSAESIVIRQYICIFIGIIYKNASQLDNNNQSESFLSETHYRKLFLILKERWIDISPFVRREAIRSLSFIQNDAVSSDHEEAVQRSPRDMLITSLGDCIPECREEAIKNLVITDNMQIKLILNVAQRDEDFRVKKIAFNKILSDEKFNEINSKTIIDVLENLLGLHQQEFKDITIDLLIHWSKNAQAKIYQSDFHTNNNKLASEDSTIILGTLHFLRDLDIYKKEKICEQALSIILQAVAERNNNSFVYVISILTDLNNGSLNLKNYRNVLDSNCSLNEKSLLLFYWRVIVELSCFIYKDRDDQRSICLFKLVPTLKTLSDFVGEFVELITENQSILKENLRGTKKKNEDLKQFCFIQLFRILHCLEQEPVGMESWKKLLFSILSNCNVYLSSNLVQEIVECIMHVHFFQEGAIEIALHEFCDTINFFVHDDHLSLNLYNELPNNVLRERSTNTENIDNLIKMDDIIRKRCLIILNAILRSGFFKKFFVELQGLCEMILKDSYVSKSMEIRSLALECLGIISLCDESYAKMHICLIEQALEVDLKAVKLTCLKVLSDLVIFYGYQKVSKWYSRMDDDDIVEIDLDNCIQNYQNTCFSYNIIKKLIDYSTSKDFDISFYATNYLCKWCLSVNDITDWDIIVCHLLLMSFRDEYKNNLKLQACLSRFIPMFAAASRKNQTLIANGFISVMNMLKERDLESDLTSISEISLAESVLKLTSYNVLLNDATDKFKGSAHSYLSQVVLTALKTNSDDYFAEIYCKMLSNIEMNDLLNECELSNLIFLCTEVFQENIDNIKNMKLIQQFLKRLTVQRDKININYQNFIKKNKNQINETTMCSISNLNESKAIKSFKSNVFASEFTTPVKKCNTNSKSLYSTIKKKGTFASIVTLTSELSINKKKESRKRELNSSTLLCVRRPIISRAAKINTRDTGAYLFDVTITEEDDNDASFKNKIKNLSKVKKKLVKDTFELSDEEEFI